MRNRVPRFLEAQGMSRERYMQLVWMCREYDAMRRRLNEMRDTLRPARYGVQPRGGGRAGDPVGDAAIRVAQSREGRCVCAIEEAAREVAGEDWPEVIRCVCRGVGFEQMAPRRAGSACFASAFGGFSQRWIGACDFVRPRGRVSCYYFIGESYV